VGSSSSSPIERCNNFRDEALCRQFNRAQHRPERRDPENWSVRITRRGPALKVEEIPQNGRGKLQPERACGNAQRRGRHLFSGGRTIIRLGGGFGSSAAILGQIRRAYLA